MTVNFERLEAEVAIAWGRYTPPDVDDLFPEGEKRDEDAAGYLDDEQGPIREWLAGRRFDQMEDPDLLDYMEVDLPFFYLSHKAGSYYLGGYLLQLFRFLKGSDAGKILIPILGPIHLLGYLGKGRLLEDVVYLDRRQISLLREIMNIVLNRRDLDGVGMNAELAARIARNRDSLL